MECIRCGNFRVTALAVGLLGDFTSQQRTNASGWLREQSERIITPDDIPFLKSIRTPTVGEKAEKVLRCITAKFSTPGETVHLSDIWNSLMSAGWASNQDELNFLILDYLVTETGYAANSSYGYRISPKGWAYLDSLRHGNPQSQTAFIAMWFDMSVDAAHLAIEEGIKNSGFDPLRIDRKEHNNKIDDEIVAGIRRSKFLVADFTGHRGGVYFEAGLATGLGLPVIWLCRKDELEKTHFDTRQYNFIVWEADKLAELSTALKNRIEATIGRGPLQPTT